MIHQTCIYILSTYKSNVLCSGDPAVTPNEKQQKRRRKKPKTPDGDIEGESAKENLGYEEDPTQGLGEVRKEIC